MESIFKEVPCTSLGNMFRIELGYNNPEIDMTKKYQRYMDIREIRDDGQVYLERYGDLVIMVDHAHTFLDSIYVISGSKVCKIKCGGTRLYIEDGQIYYENGKSSNLYCSTISETDESFWLKNLDKIQIDVNKTTCKELTNPQSVGYFEGHVFAFFGHNDRFIVMDQNRNLYYKDEIFAHFKELRPSFNKNDYTGCEWCTQALHNYNHTLSKSCFVLSKTFDGSLTKLAKNHVSKLHPKTRSIIKIFMMKRLRDKRLYLPVVPIPVLFIIFEYAFLDYAR